MRTLTPGVLSIAPGTITILSKPPSRESDIVGLGDLRREMHLEPHSVITLSEHVSSGFISIAKKS